MNVFTSNEKIKYCTGNCGKYEALHNISVKINQLFVIENVIVEKELPQYIRESSVVLLKEFNTVEEAKAFLENNFNVSNIGKANSLQHPYNLKELVNSNVNKELTEKFSNDIVSFLSDSEKVNANNTLFFDLKTQKLIELDCEGNPRIREVIHDHDGIHCVNKNK